MRSLDVCLSPEMSELYNLSGKIVVVVDILRATSCMTTGLAQGVSSIRPMLDLELCRQMKAEGYFIAGERGGQHVEGFDLGNSPFDYMDEVLKGRNVAVTTTNGTVAIEKSLNASTVVIGSFLNLTTVSNYCKQNDADLVIFCAGWKGRFNMEDTLFAGALAQSLQNDFEFEDDSVVMATSMYESHRHDLLSLVSRSSHARRLKKFDVTKDIEFCLRHDEYDVLPILQSDGHITAE